MKPAPAAHIGS